jgi:hypothetical protein
MYRRNTYAMSIIFFKYLPIFVKVTPFFATVRDDIRCLLGGSEVVEATFKLNKLFEDDAFKDAVVKIQRWPRDIDLRKGVLFGT